MAALVAAEAHPWAPRSVEMLTTSTATTSDGARQSELRVFLVERIRDAWSVDVGETPPISERPDGQTYYVGLHWSSDQAVRIEIQNSDALLGMRTFMIGDDIDQS